MKLLLLILAAMPVTACDVLDARRQAHVPAVDEVVYCGSNFTIAIPKGDRFVTDPLTPEDFILYYWIRGAERIPIYAGNHPEDGGVVIETGKDWPSVIVVHGTEQDAKTVRVTDEEPTGCKPPETLPENGE